MSPTSSSSTKQWQWHNGSARNHHFNDVMKFITAVVTFAPVSALIGQRFDGTAGKLSHRFASPLNLRADEPSEESWDTCPDPPEDKDLDRREALFAMMGSMWSVGLVGDAIMVGGQGSPANAFGEDAKMEFPDVMAGLSDRANKQCIVESLGNRECLVYMDPANAVYQGQDVSLLLERIEMSARALSSIPEYAESKQWSKVVGVLTGPMGTLTNTMNQLSGGRKELLEAAKNVKNDIISIGQAAGRKDKEKVLLYHQRATESLVQFVSKV